MGYGCAEEPGQCWDAKSCVDEMQSRGVAWVPFEEDDMADLGQIWRNMPDMEELFEESADGTFYGCEVPSHRGPARFILNSSAISQNMRWLWVYDEETLALFDELALKTNLLSVLGGVDDRVGDLMLYSASFIVVKGPRLGDAETLRHADMEHRRIPRGSSFTCLAPVAALPRSVGGLQFWPWESPLYSDPKASQSAPPRVHKYSPGRFVAFDGRLKHRTEPFEYGRPAGADPRASACCDEYEANGQLRVLVSLAFGSKDARLARYNHKMLRKQTCHEEALIRQSPKREVDIDSELDTSDSDSECQRALSGRGASAARADGADRRADAGSGGGAAAELPVADGDSAESPRVHRAQASQEVQA